MAPRRRWPAALQDGRQWPRVLRVHLPIGHATGTAHGSGTVYHLGALRSMSVRCHTHPPPPPGTVKYELSQGADIAIASASSSVSCWPGCTVISIAFHSPGNCGVL